jgi:hypothetical protein
MTLTIDLSSLLPVQRIAPAAHLRAALALPTLAAALFFSLAPVEDPRPVAWPGQSCQEKLAAAEAALNARERGGEVSPATP